MKRLAIALIFIFGCVEEKPIVTMADYLRVREGMTYNSVVSVIGSGGQQIASSQSVFPYLDIKMYSWENRDGSNMNAMFQNGGLVSKAQYGLR